MLARCIVEGIVGGENLGVDASLIKADASRYTKADFLQWSAEDGASRATQEYLETLDGAAFGAARPVKPKVISPSDFIVNALFYQNTLVGPVLVLIEDGNGMVQIIARKPSEGIYRTVCMMFEREAA